MPLLLRIEMNRSSVDLVFLDLTLAMILERSVFENVSTVMSLDDFYPRLVEFDCLEDSASVYVGRFLDSYCKPVVRNVLYYGKLRPVRLPCKEVLIVVFTKPL